MLGHFDDDYDKDFWDKPDRIPYGYIIGREIQKAIRGESFFYNDEDTGKPVYCEPVTANEFTYYYKIWENYNSFGLPHGKGWISERGWLLEFLKIFSNVHTICLNIKDDKLRRHLEARHGRH